MKINLFVNLYCDESELRQKELDFCLQKNIENELIDNIFIICLFKDYSYLRKKFDADKLEWHIYDTRPTYNNYFDFMSLYENQINILSNADIYFDETLSLVRSHCLDSSVCFALTKWENVNGELKLYNNGSADSQDTWVFYGCIKEASRRANVSFGLGVAGCDNAIAYLLKESGYEVENPSKSIRTIHVHDTNIRNYVDASGAPIERIPPPYLLIEPTVLI